MILKRARQNLRSRSRPSINQNDERNVFRVVIDGGVLAGRKNARSASHCDNLLAFVEKYISDLLRLVDQTASIISEIQNERGHPLPFKVSHGLPHLLVRSRVESALKRDVADAVADHVVSSYRRDRNRFARELELKRLAYTRPQDFDDDSCAFWPEQLLADLSHAPAFG